MNVLKNLLLTAILSGISVIAFAQADEDLPQQPIDPKARERVEAARIALITNRLALTPEQAEKFWPIYREFTEKRLALRQEFRQQQQIIDPSNPDPKKQQELINFGLQLKQKDLDLEKDYSSRILSVINAQQLLNLRKAEQDFRQLILNQLQQRRALQQRKELFRDKNQKLRPNKQ
jgi:hypothetical protein